MKSTWRARGREPPGCGEPTLTAADWAEAALQLIAEKGLGALTVSALAARLGVTKGSFYWHFARTRRPAGGGAGALGATVDDDTSAASTPSPTHGGGSN